MQAKIGAFEEGFDIVAFSSDGFGVKGNVYISDEVQGEFEGTDALGSEQAGVQ